MGWGEGEQGEDVGGERLGGMWISELELKETNA
jgi:hypothetical protein